MSDRPQVQLTWPRARLIFVAAAILAVVVIVGLSSGLTFHGDEWAYIVDRRLTFESMIKPHNEHLVFLHVLVYRAMVETIGIDSYLPYLIVLAGINVATAAGTFTLLSRQVARAGALAGGVLMLFLGTGFDDLIWGFQIGFAGAIALGTWAMVTVDRSWISATLLTAALWTAGSGLFFIAPVAVLIAKRKWLLLPLGSYALWFLIIGREFVPVPEPGPYLAYLLTGIGSSVGGLAGLSVVPGWLLASMIVVLLLRSGRPNNFVIAGLLGIVFEFAILAFGRAHFGPQQAEAPRYIHAAAPFVLMWLSGIRGIPRFVWASAFVAALLLNAWALPRGVAIYHAFVAHDRTLTLDERLAPFRSGSSPEPSP